MCNNLVNFWIQLLRELARVIYSPDLEKQFATVWREKVEMLFKLARKNTSPKVQKVVKELDDLGQEEISGMYCIKKCSVPKLMSVLFFVDSLLTVKILSILPFIIPDHKVKPAPERLLTTIPVLPHTFSFFILLVFTFYSLYLIFVSLSCESLSLVPPLSLPQIPQYHM